MTISNEDLVRLDDHYVKCAECQERHKDVDDQIKSLTVAFTETKSQFKMLMGMLGAIGTIVAGILAKLLFG